MTREELSLAALAEGFSQVGVAEAGPSLSGAAFREWLARGYHADMAWLEAHADLRDDPRNLLPSAKSVVVVTLDYGQAAQPDPLKARIARYAMGRDYHKIIRRKLRRLAAKIPGASRVCVDSAPLPEREWGHRAGLGWFGKNTMLIDSQRGSWCLLGVLLTEFAFPPDSPSVGGCGTCRLCIEHCPTGAIVFADDRWQIDARKCISYQTIELKADELTEDTHGWTFGCDVCQEVCPFNTPRASQPLRGRPATEPDLIPRQWPPLTELATLDYDEWDRLTQGSSVRRAGYEGLKRNARANLDGLVDGPG